MNGLFGTEQEEESSSVGEKVGDERLGSSNIMGNFGLTLLIISTVLLVLVLLVLLGSYIIKRTGYSGKVKQRLEQLKKSLFFNLLIGYILLNGLKYYILGFSSLHRSDSDVGSKIVGGLVILLYFILPLFFAYILYKMEKKKNLQL